MMGSSIKLKLTINGMVFMIKKATLKVIGAGQVFNLTRSGSKVVPRNGRGRRCAELNSLRGTLFVARNKIRCAERYWIRCGERARKPCTRI